jgi:hypothetical protein
MKRVAITSPRLAALAALIVCCTPTFAQNKIGIFTQQVNTGRTGLNPDEKVLTPAKVTEANFGKIFSYSVDGQVYAQPLYVYGVKIPGQGTHNAVYVVTQYDSVFAFDADGKQSTPLWQDSFIDLAQGIGPVPCGTDGQGSDISCGVYPLYGITGTPVIDPSTNTMYLVARTYNNKTFVGYQTLHALDITTGAEKFGGPVQITGSVTGTGLGSQGGTVNFNELADIQRPGLLLLNGVVYIGWAGAEHGWIMGYTAKDLVQTAVFSPTANAERGGVWQGGNGLASDGAYIYASSGDGLFDANANGGDYGDTLMKLDSTLAVQDYFTPLEQDCRYENDFDLASSGPMVLPAQTGSAHLYQIITSGKGGSPCDTSGFAPIYVADRTNMGKYNAQQDNVLQEISGAPSGYWSSPAYFVDGSEAAVYYSGTTQEGGSGAPLTMYTRSKGVLSTTPSSTSSNIFPIGVTPAVSSNGSKDGIVWAIERPDSLSAQPGEQPAVLYAYDATNVTTAIYNSGANASRDQGGCANKFAVPTIANGKVYVGTQNELDIFGILGTAPAVSVALDSPCYNFAVQAVGTTSPPEYLNITNTGTSTLTGLSVSIIGLDPADFAQTGNCTGSLGAGASCRLKLTFTPAATGPRIASLQIIDNAPNSPQNAQLTGRGK